MTFTRKYLDFQILRQNVISSPADNPPTAKPSQLEKGQNALSSGTLLLPDQRWNLSRKLASLGNHAIAFARRTEVGGWSNSGPCLCAHSDAGSTSAGKNWPRRLL